LEVIAMSCLKPMIVAVVFGSLFAGGAALALQAPATAADDKPTAKFEVYKDRSGEFRWRLRATNTQILATSGDAYKAKRDCLHAIDSIKRAAANAPVEELGDGQGATVGENKAGDAETPANAKRPAR
jgi:uncharacterized protein YegP (UPF0339 family)